MSGRIGTYYDKELGKKCFIVKDTESYARTTDIDLIVGSNTYHNLESFTVPISVQVYRDTGSSEIAIWDNDDLLGIYSYTASLDSSTPTVLDSALELSYNTRHSLRAEYRGNNDCLKSVSKYVPIEIETPPSVLTSITINNAVNSYVFNSITLSFTVNATASTVSGHDTGTAHIYVDDEEFTTKSFTFNESATVSLDSVDDGLHTVRVVFDGDSYVTASTKEWQFSKGGVVEISAPRNTVLTHSFDLTATLKDYFGDEYQSAVDWAVTGTDHTFEYYDGTEWIDMSTPQTSTSPMTYTDVYVDGVNAIEMGEEFDPSLFDSFSADYNVSATSSSVDFDVITPRFIEMSATSTNLLQDGNAIVSGTVTADNDFIASNIPVLITTYEKQGRSGNTIAVDVETVYTDDNGVFNYSYTADSVFNRFVKAECIFAESEIEMCTVTEYWNVLDTGNEIKNNATIQYTNVKNPPVQLGYGYQFKSVSSSSPSGHFEVFTSQSLSTRLRFTVRGGTNYGDGLKLENRNEWVNKLEYNKTYELVRFGTSQAQLPTGEGRFELYEGDYHSGNYIGSVTGSDLYSKPFQFHIGVNGKSTSLVLNNIKLMRVK